MDGVEVIMPRMGETVDEGTVNEWFKQVGDPVAEGEPLLEIGRASCRERVSSVV